jgi:exosortase E/protease (VPEID-CTERM system)
VSWGFNAVRISALVAIGAYVSPEVAVNGFHSQAGWIFFLLISVSILFLVPRVSFFVNGSHSIAQTGSVHHFLAEALLLPFIGFMAARLVVTASAPHNYWVYCLYPIAIGLPLFLYRRIYSSFFASVSSFSVAVGVSVGALWILSSPDNRAPHAIETWFVDQSGFAVMLWLIVRGLSSVVFVPIAEELAFRGFLYRWLIDRKFDLVGLRDFSFIALAVSSLAFGVLHERWIAGTVAGFTFAILMIRTGRLSDPIAAHMTANALIFAWAIATEDWASL